MKCLLIILFSISSQATPTETKLLAQQLWELMEKETATTYTIIDKIRAAQDEADPLRTYLIDSENFKKSQKILGSSFVERINKDFSRKEILNLIKIYKSREFSKMRDLNIEYWDEAKIKDSLKSHISP